MAGDADVFSLMNGRLGRVTENHDGNGQRHEEKEKKNRSEP
jgi:hypothetical protein